MPLLSATRPGWFEILEQGMAARSASGQVTVYHPQVQGRLRFERGRRVAVEAEGFGDERSAAERLRTVGEGGYFELRRASGAPDDPNQVVVCAEPYAMHTSACAEASRHEMLDALLGRRFATALALYTAHCATCRSRGTCKSVTMVERNAPRLVALSAGDRRRQ